MAGEKGLAEIVEQKYKPNIFQASAFKLELLSKRVTFVTSNEIYLLYYTCLINGRFL